MTGADKTKFGPLYIHFKEQCLKDFYSKIIYGVNEGFQYDKIKIADETRGKLTKDDIEYLAKLGIH